MASTLSLGSLYKDLPNRLRPNRPAIFWISRLQKPVVVTIRALKLCDIIAASKCVSFGILLRARLQLLQLYLLLQHKQRLFFIQIKVVIIVISSSSSSIIIIIIVIIITDIIMVIIINVIVIMIIVIVMIVIIIIVIVVIVVIRTNLFDGTGRFTEITTAKT